MNKIKDGGPAFPTFNAISHCDEGGMTLRDYFAAKALSGLLAHGAQRKETGEAAQPCWYANTAYAIADAMLVAASHATAVKNDGWVSVNDRLPGAGQFIEGRNSDGDSWREQFDPDEPIGRMVEWRVPREARA